jgi:hypothetical protein
MCIIAALIRLEIGSIVLLHVQHVFFCLLHATRGGSALHSTNWGT